MLTGRHGVQSPSQAAVVEGLTAQGATIRIAAVDAADAAGMAHLVADIVATGPRLAGVIHLAGVSGQKALTTLAWDDFVDVLRPKILGAWLLHCLTAGLELDFWLCYSSGAGIWGGKQQAHYAAANQFLDGLVAWRRSQGLPGLSIAWGPWVGGAGQPGMAGAVALAQWEMLGVRALTGDEGLAILAHLLRTAGGEFTAAAVDWASFAPVYAAAKARPFLAQLAPIAPVLTPAGAAGSAGLATGVAGLPTSRRSQYVQEHVRNRVARILGLAAGPDAATGFAELGMDSLMAVELRRQLEQDCGCGLPATLAFEYPTVDRLAGYLLNEVLGWLPCRRSTAQGADAQRPADGEDAIAVVGMACRFPGAETPEAFWQLLHGGVDMVREVPAERWNVDEFYDPQRPLPGKMYMREAAFAGGGGGI